MEQTLETKLKELLDNDQRNEVGQLISTKDNQTQIEMNLFASNYFAAKGEYVNAIWCAQGAEQIYQILDNPRALDVAMSFANQGLGGRTGPQTPLQIMSALSNTPERIMDKLLFEYFAARKIDPIQYMQK